MTESAGKSVRTPAELPDGVSQATLGVRGGLLRSGFEETAEAMALSARLLDEGVFVTGFGFPVVPEGTARVRVQMSAALEPEHLGQAIDAFRRVRPS